MVIEPCRENSVISVREQKSSKILHGNYGGWEFMIFRNDRMSFALSVFISALSANYYSNRKL